MTKRKESKTLQSQYLIQGGCCYYCKTKIKYEEITRDHFFPKSKGYTLFKNKVFACRFCNSSKGHKSIEEFRESVLYIIQTKVLNEHKLSIYKRILITIDEIIELQNFHEILLT